MEIIVAEDNRSSVELLVDILESAGHRTFVCPNGRDAWQLFQEKKSRIVLSEWIMPEMSGIELCRRIRGAQSIQYTYILLLTCKDNDSAISEAFDAGVDDYLTKPFNPQELLDRIRAGERIIQLEEGYKRLNYQLLQSEKMASVGQLAAGVAHEINNPTGFVSSNLSALSDYQIEIRTIIQKYKKLVSNLKTSGNLSSAIIDQIAQIEFHEMDSDMDFIMDDIQALLGDCKEGTERIKKIVVDLKDFAHPGEDEKKAVDINQCIASSLNVVWNELKYKADVTKHFGRLPLIEGYPQQLNQVFMNILVNAAQAILKKGEIKITTSVEDDFIVVAISDNGVGIAREHLSNIFDPFFTTKPVGSGSGLGMHVAYNIVRKHQGTVEVKSKLGQGTVIKIRIPVGLEFIPCQGDGASIDKGVCS